MLIVFKYIRNEYRILIDREEDESDKDYTARVREADESHPDGFWKLVAEYPDKEMIGNLGDGEYAVYKAEGEPNKHGLYESFKLQRKRTTVEVPPTPAPVVS